MTSADFWRIWRAITRRKWLMVAVVGCTMLVVGVGAALMPRYYRATALVMPSDQTLQRPVVAVGAAVDRAYNPQAREERLANLIYLAQSQAVIARAAASLRLTEPPKKLSRRINADALPRTAILRISVLDRDPDRSIRIANSVAQAFTTFYRELSHREAVENRAFLERELDAAKQDLDRAQAELAHFRASEGGLALDLGTAPPVVSPLESERDSAEAQLRETTARLAAARARLEKESPTVVSEQGTTDNPAVAKLRTDLIDLESKLAAERAVHTDRHPNVISLEAQIEDLQRRLRTEMERVIKHTIVARNPLFDNLAMQVADLEAHQAALQARVQAMNEVVAREHSRFAEASSRGVQVAALTRDYRIADETHARLKAAVDQARINEKVTSDAGAIQIVDLARTADGPVARGPAPWHLLLMGLVLSLAVAFGLALALDVLDDRVKSTDDVMRLLNLPVTGVIPAIEGVRVKQLPLVTQALPSSPYAEAYRFLRTDLLFTCEDQPLQTLCVVTPKPGQGGTTTIANLAIALAEADRRVILVDADLRRPSLHDVFGLSADRGLTSVVGEGLPLSEALQQTGIPNLLLLAAGPTAHNPSNLISSNRMRALMRELRAHADFVLFDTPSAMAFSDAAIIASMTDGTLLVVRARQPLRGRQLQVTSLLNKARANVIGVVLNDVAPEEVETSYFYAHYYSPQLPPGAPEAPALPAPAQDAQTPPDAAEPQREARVGEELDAQSGRAIPRSREALATSGEVAPAEVATAAPAPRRRLVSGIFSALLVCGAAYLALAGMGYAPLPRFGGGQEALAPAVGERANARLADRVRLVASVNTPTLARITADDQVLYDGVLVPGRNEWRAAERITVWVERPEAVSLEHNGQRLGALGRAGDRPVTREFVAATAADAAPAEVAR